LGWGVFGFHIHSIYFIHSIWLRIFNIIKYSLSLGVSGFFLGFWAKYLRSFTTFPSLPENITWGVISLHPWKGLSTNSPSYSLSSIFVTMVRTVPPSRRRTGRFNPMRRLPTDNKESVASPTPP
jgi:hypothetical protein